MTSNILLKGRTEPTWFYRCLSLLLNTTLTGNLLFLLSHFLLNFYVFFLELLYLFLIEESELIEIVRKIKSFLQSNSQFIKSWSWEVVSSPNIHTLMNHSKKSRRKFNQIHHILIISIFINTTHKVRSSSLNTPNMRSILNYFCNFRQQIFLNSLNNCPIITFHRLFHKLQGAYLSSRSISIEQPYYFSDYCFDFWVLGVIPDIWKQHSSVFNGSEISHIEKMLNIVHKFFLGKVIDGW